MLICSDGSEPVWIGYRINGEWRDAEGFRVNVTYWSPIPAGPH